MMGRRRRRRWRGAWLLAATLGAGCASARLPHVPGDPPPALNDPAREQGYQIVLEQWTRHGAVYDNLDTKLFAYVTWQSAPFVEARVRRLCEFKDVLPADADALLAAEQARVADATEFFVAVHANDSHFDDFDRPGSMWRLALNFEGRDVAPLSIERLGRTNTELRAVYSFMESFWVGYRVRFPRVNPQPGQVMTFKLASALGRAELAFTPQ
jgi:hypothetical protein